MINFNKFLDRLLKVMKKIFKYCNVNIDIRRTQILPKFWNVFYGLYPEQMYSVKIISSLIVVQSLMGITANLTRMKLEKHSTQTHILHLDVPFT